VATPHQTIRWAVAMNSCRAEGARRLLADVAAELGSTAAVRGRRVRPPR